MDVFSNIVLSFVELISLYLITSSTLQRRYTKSIIRNVCFFISAIIFVALSVFLNIGNLPLRMCLLLCSLTILLFINYKSSLLKIFFVGAFYHIVTNAIDYFVMSFSFIIFHFTYDEIMGGGSAFYVSAFTAKTLLLTVSAIFYRVQKKRAAKVAYLSGFSWLVLLVMPVFSVINMAFIAEFSYVGDAVTPFTIFTVIGLIFCNVISIFLWNKFEEDSWIRLENKLLQEKVKSTMDKTLALETAYSKHRRLTHDFRNHTQALLGFLDAAEFDNALRYIKTLNKSIANAEDIICTHHPLIDTILNQKYEEAKQQGVTVTFLINELERISIRDDDLVSLLANLIDNAITAACNCSTDKSVHIKLNYELDYGLLISIRNSSEPVIIQDGIIVATKESSLEHGFGLQNVKQVIEKYGGIFLFSYENGQVQFTAKIPEIV